MSATMMSLNSAVKPFGLSRPQRLAVRVSALFKGTALTREGTKTAKVAVKASKVSRKESSTTTSSKPALPFTLGFTKSNELFVGRVAMLGFASGLIGEVLTGKGVLAQIGYETKIGDQLEIDAFIIGLVLFNLVAALLPTSGTFVPENQELGRRQPGALQNPKISLLNPREFFGITEFGFTKENELFVGRVAQLGFVAAIVGEVVTGKGPLAQIGLETGIPIQDTEFGLLVFIAFFLFAAINEGSGKFVDEEPL